MDDRIRLPSTSPSILLKDDDAGFSTNLRKMTRSRTGLQTKVREIVLSSDRMSDYETEQNNDDYDDILGDLDLRSLRKILQEAQSLRVFR